MPTTKKSSKGIINKHSDPIYHIGILFPDGKKITKLNCNVEEFCNTYFINLDKLIKNEDTPEGLLIKYQTNYKNKGIKIGVKFIDSWGHIWKGKVAWPPKEKILDYLNRKLNDKLND